jgi:hypothetical protein
MTTNLSYTVAVTSDLAGEVAKAIAEKEQSVDKARWIRLQEIQKRVNDLKSRGLLRKQDYISVSNADFERRYSVNKKDVNTVLASVNKKENF